MGQQDQNELVESEHNHHCWLAIGATDVRHSGVGASTYWCLPMNVKPDDNVYMYIPRAQNSSRHGIVALACVAKAPTGRDRNEHICKPYSLQRERLYYTPLTIYEVYQEPLTAYTMKCDNILATSPFVRRNFQATVFPLTCQHADRISTLLKHLNSTQ